MGASQSSSSRSVSTMMVNDNSSVMSSVVQSASAAIDQSIIIDVNNTAGDVNITGNTMSQQATVNLSAVFDTMAQNAVQKDLALKANQSS